MEEKNTYTPEEVVKAIRAYTALTPDVMKMRLERVPARREIRARDLLRAVNITRGAVPGNIRTAEFEGSTIEKELRTLEAECRRHIPDYNLSSYS